MQCILQYYYSEGLSNIHAWDLIMTPYAELETWLYLARWWKLVRKWPMADCYFIYDFITARITWFSEINFKVLNHLEEIKLLWKQRWSAKSHNLIASALVWHLYTSLYSILCISDHQFKLAIKASSSLKTCTLVSQQLSFFIYVVGQSYSNKAFIVVSIRSFSITLSLPFSQ